MPDHALCSVLRTASLRLAPFGRLAREPSSMRILRTTIAAAEPGIEAVWGRRGNPLAGAPTSP